MIKTQQAKPPPVKEADIQAAIINRLSQKGWVAVRVNSSAFKGDAGNYIRGYIVAGLNASSGYPDIVAHKDERCLLIEVKRPDGKLTDSQEKFHAFAKERGVVVHVVRSPEEVEKLIEAKP